MIYLFIISAALHACIFCVLGIASVTKKKRKGNSDAVAPSKEIPLSVILCAHNEERNLQHILPALIQQEHKNFELILVLDRCTDPSFKIGDEFAQKDPRIKIVQVSETPEGFAPKKWAVTKGIESSANEWLVFTDADCFPGTQWLSQIAAATPGTDLIIGQSPYKKIKGILNLFLRYETLQTAVLYSGSANLGFPYMAVGRNLAYRKKLFEEAGGFSRHQSKLSGDDDLLVNAVGAKAKTVVLTSEESLVPSEPPETFPQWWLQKTRHVSASGGYSPGSKAFLATFQGSQVIFYLSLGLLPFSGELSSWIWLLTGGRWVLEMAAIFPSAMRWNQVELAIMYPLLDALYFFYNLLVVPAGWLRKPEWTKR